MTTLACSEDMVSLVVSVIFPILEAYARARPERQGDQRERGLTQVPLRPPDLDSSATASMVTPRSTPLTMS